MDDDNSSNLPSGGRLFPAGWAGGEGESKIKHAMVIAALSWFFISLISSIPFYFIEHMDFLSSFFESVAGWTGTGLTMITHESGLTHTIQFWRTFTQWVGESG